MSDPWKGRLKNFKPPGTLTSALGWSIMTTSGITWSDPYCLYLFLLSIPFASKPLHRETLQSGLDTASKLTVDQAGKILLLEQTIMYACLCSTYSLIPLVFVMVNGCVFPWHTQHNGILYQWLYGFICGIVSSVCVCVCVCEYVSFTGTEALQNSAECAHTLPIHLHTGCAVHSDV